jgi:hypothetical protein
MKIVFALFALFVSLPSVFAQNLVPNPSFEEYENCENSNVQTAMEYVVDWFNPNAWSSDYFKDFELPCAANTNGPTNSDFLAPQPYDGNSFVGSFYYLYQNEEFETREYIEVHLTEPLTQGQAYQISWWVSMGAKSKYRVNSFGAAFTSTPIDDQSELFAFDLIPQVEVIDFFGSSEEWQQIVDTIWATGGEQFLTIGTFKHDAELELEQINSGNNLVEGAYYVIDLVEVLAIPVGIGNETKNDTPSIIFFENQIHIVNNTNSQCVYQLYSTSGELLLTSSLSSSNEIIDCHSFAAGMYFLKCVIDEKSYSSKLIIETK